MNGLHAVADFLREIGRDDMAAIAQAGAEALEPPLMMMQFGAPAAAEAEMRESLRRLSRGAPLVAAPSGSIYRVSAVGEWVPVADRLPEPRTWVICLTSFGSFVVAADNLGDGQSWSDQQGYAVYPTYWMPIPPAPEGDAR